MPGQGAAAALLPRRRIWRAISRRFATTSRRRPRASRRPRPALAAAGLRWFLLGVAALAIAAVSLLRPRTPAAELQSIRFSLRAPPDGFRGDTNSPFHRTARRSPSLRREADLAAAALRARGASPARNGWRGLSLLVARWPLHRLSSPPTSCGASDLSGGAPVPICDVPERRDTQGPGGPAVRSLFAGMRGEAIYRVSASGGKPVAIVKADRARGETTGQVALVSSGRQELPLPFFAGGRRRQPDVFAAPRGLPARFSRCSPGSSTSTPDTSSSFETARSIAQRFDPRSGVVSGEPFSIADSVGYYLSYGCAAFSTSRSGALAFQTPGTAPRRRMVWLDRAGRLVETLTPTGRHRRRRRLDPDGRRVLFDRTEPKTGTNDLWILDLERNVETRVTSNPAEDLGGIWLPDGNSIVYTAEGGGCSSCAGGSWPRDGKWPFSLRKQEQSEDVVPGGAQLAYLTNRPGRHGCEAGFSVGRPEILAAVWNRRHSTRRGRFSPDGRLHLFGSDDSGRDEALRRSGCEPGGQDSNLFRRAIHGVRLWSRDGSEIFYFSAGRHMMSVPVRTTPSLWAGKPSPLFTLKEDAAWDSLRRVAGRQAVPRRRSRRRRRGAARSTSS